MKHEDTINLLKECNAGVKMGVDSIDDVLGYVQNENLKQMLTASKEEHQRGGADRILDSHGLRKELKKYVFTRKNQYGLKNVLSMWISD